MIDFAGRYATASEEKSSVGKKKPSDAARELQRSDYDAWRLLVRNPSFLSDLHALRRLRSEHDPLYEDRREEILDSWSLSRIPPHALLPYADSDSESLESYYKREVERHGVYHVGRAASALIELKEDKYLYCWVNVTKSVDTVLAALESDLRGFYRFRSTQQKRKRGRPEKLDDQLQVFDLVTGSPGGKKLDFETVARKLRKPPETIRDSYASACTKVGYPRKKGGQPELKMDPGIISECADPSCRLAKTPEDFCPAHRLLIPPDVCLREQLVTDLSAVEHARARKASGKRTLPTTDD